MEDYKAGGEKGNSNLFATNRLFKKSPLFRKRKKKAPGVYDPKAKYRFDKGGEKNKCKDGEYWDGEKCTRLITYATDQKLIDGVANWAMHSADPDKISLEYNDQIKHYLYTGKYGYDPINMSLIPLKTIDKKLISEPDEETKAIREKEKITEKKYFEEIEKDEAYNKALVDEPKYADEGLDFVKGWHDSPMYNQMVLNSFHGNQLGADYLTKLRKENIADIPPINIMATSGTSPYGFNPAATSNSKTGKVKVYPEGFGWGPSIYTHEYFHTSDKPRGIYNWDFINSEDPRFPNDKERSNERVMPESDQMYITRNRGSNWKDNEDYKSRVEKWPEAYNMPTDEKIKKILYSQDVTEDDKDFQKSFNNLKNIIQTNHKISTDTNQKEWKTFAHDYVSQPTEVRARLGEIRYQAKKDGIYDPFIEQITPEIFQNYLNKKRSHKNWIDSMSPIKDLRKQFTDEEILWMLQNISKNDEGEEEIKVAAKGGALLTKKVTCKKCGWKWDAADGGDDITTCHKCGGQGLIHAKNGGDLPPKVGVSYLPKGERSYYDPIMDNINLDSNASEGELNHEMAHAWQNRQDGFRSDPYSPKLRPSAAASDEQAATYFNRKGDDVDRYLSNLNTIVPELGGHTWNKDIDTFMPDQIKYDKVIDPLMYSDPNTLEGEAEYMAQVYGRPPLEIRKKGGASEQKIIFSPMEGGCPEGQYWTGTECKIIPKNTKIVYSEAELAKSNITKKEQQKLYNQYITRAKNHNTIEAAILKKYGKIGAKDKYYKTFESIPKHGFSPMMSYGTGTLIENGLGLGIPSLKESMIGFNEWKKRMNKSSVKPIGFKGHPGGGHFYPIYEKPSNYLLGYNKEEEPIIPIDPIKEEVVEPAKIIDPVKEEVIVPTVEPVINKQESPLIESMGTQDYPEELKGSDWEWDKKWHSFTTPRLNKHFPLGPLFNGKKKHNFSTPYLHRRKDYEDGGIIADLSPEEIEEYRKGGYVIEDISVPSLSHMDEGGALNKFVEGGSTDCDQGMVWSDELQDCVREQAIHSVKMNQYSPYVGAWNEMHPREREIIQKKAEYLNKHKGLNRIAGVNQDNFPEKVLRNIENKVDYERNNYVIDQYSKKHGLNPNDHVELVEQLADKGRNSYDMAQNSKYGSKLKPSLWARTAAGAQELGNFLVKQLPGKQGDVFNKPIKGLTKKEYNEIHNSNTGALETLAVGDITGQAIANAVLESGKTLTGGTGADYKTKDIPNVLSGEFMPGVTDAVATVFNPLTYTGLAGGLVAAPKMAASVANLYSKGLTGGKKIVTSIDNAVYPTRTYRAELPGGNLSGWDASDLSKKVFNKGDFSTKKLDEVLQYLIGSETEGGRQGLVTGQDMNFTEYKVPFWKKNVSFDPDVIELKKSNGFFPNSNEYIIPNNKFLYPRKTTVIKAVPEELKTFQPDIFSGSGYLPYEPLGSNVIKESSNFASKPYKYIEDQLNAVTGHDMPFTYKFDPSLRNQVIPNRSWKQPQFPVNKSFKYGGLHKFAGGGHTCRDNYVWNEILQTCVPMRCPYGYEWSNEFDSCTRINNLPEITVTGKRRKKLFSPYKTSFETTDDKIKQTKKKGMVYQSTADELKKLEAVKQKEIEEEIKRKELARLQALEDAFNATNKSDNTNVALPTAEPLKLSNSFTDPIDREKALNKETERILNSGQGMFGVKDLWDDKHNALSLRELIKQQLSADPKAFYEKMENASYQDFVDREQKEFDNTNWLYAGLNELGNFAADPILTGATWLEGSRTGIQQGKHVRDVTDPDYNNWQKKTGYNDNWINSTFNIINPLASSADAAVSFLQGDALGFGANTAGALLKTKILTQGLNATSRELSGVLNKEILGSKYLTGTNALRVGSAYKAGTEYLPNVYESGAKIASGEGTWEDAGSGIYNLVKTGTAALPFTKFNNAALYPKIANARNTFGFMDAGAGAAGGDIVDYSKAVDKVNKVGDAAKPLAFSAALRFSKLKKEGGAIEKNMSKSEIKKLIAQGYVIEEI